MPLSPPLADQARSTCSRRMFAERDVRSASILLSPQQPRGWIGYARPPMTFLASRLATRIAPSVHPKIIAFLV